MSNKENLLLRIKAVQALDQLYYQKGEHLYSHRRVCIIFITNGCNSIRA